MAGTTTAKKITTLPRSDQRFTAVQVNNLIADVERLRLALETVMPGGVITAPANKKGTTSEKTWRTEAFTFKFRGKTVSAAAQEKAFTATTHDVAADKEAWYVLSVQSDGTTFTITKAADQTPGTVVLPIAPDNEVIVGYLKIVTSAGGIFDATTDDVEVAGFIIAVVFSDAALIGAAAYTAAQMTSVDTQALPVV